MLELVVLVGLASWRTAVMLVQEQGPWHVFRWIREMVGIIHDEDGEPAGIPDALLAGIFGCVWCASAWIAVALVPAYNLEWGRSFVVVMAAAGIASMVESLRRR